MYQDFKQIGKHFGIYGSAAIFRRLAGFLLIPVYTRFLTPQDYGLANFIQTIFLLISSVIGLHLVSAMSRFYYEYEDSGRYRVLKTVYSVIFATTLLLMIIVMALSQTISKTLLNSSQYYIFFIIAVFTTFLRVNNSITYSLYRIRMQSVKYTLFSVGEFMVTFIVSFFLIVILKKGVIGFFWGAASGALVIFLCFIPKTIYYATKGISKSYLKILFWYATPLIFAGFLHSFLFSIDKFLIKGFLNLKALGLYSLAFSFGMAIQTIISHPIQQVWYPYVYSNLKKPHIKELIRRFTLIFCLCMSMIYFISTIFIRDIIMLISKEAFWPAAKIAPFTIFLFYTYAVMSIPQVSIKIAKKTKYLLWLNIYSAALLILSNVVLLPKIGIMGAGLSLAITAIFRIIFIFFYSEKCFRVNYNIYKIFIIFVITFIFTIIGCNIRTTSTALYYISKILLIPVFCVSFIVFKIVSVEDIKEVFLLLSKKGKTSR